MSETLTNAATEHSERLLTAIRKYWGYGSFRPLQREAMSAALEGNDSLTVLPTGGGKSLCYQTPALCREGMAIVVSPLIALMKDQVDALTACGIPAAFINSSLTPEERMQVARRIRSGELKLLFAAPERLVQDRTIDFLQGVSLSFIAIDEAHCISNWGHDFRPEYRQLARLREAFPDVSLHAFTATATEQVRQDIIDQLHLHECRTLVGNFDRPNLIYRVERRHDAIGQIREVIDRHPDESGIIYCISRKNTEETAATLNSCGYRALAYHAGMEPEQRRAHQESFIEEKVNIIVATVAFGMGIDKSNVRYVVHAEMPRSLEAYQQESGRAGRDGLEAECCLLYSGRDIGTWEYLINQSEHEENREALLGALRHMESFCSSVSCRHRQLVQHFGQDLDSENCGACDVCLNEIEKVDDPLIVAQKIISSVYRQEQRFGGDYTTLVLRGSKSRKVVRNGHDQLSTWGLLEAEAEPVVRGWIDQLVSQGFLRRSGEHSVLVITAEGMGVLKGEMRPTLTKPKPRQQAAAERDQWEGVDRGLFDALRRLRIEIASERGVPPYVIFGDMTLRELARYRPTTVDSLLKVYGIGQQKLEEFGAAVVAAISEYSTEQELTTDLPITSQSSQKNATRKTKSASHSEHPTAASEAYFDLFDQGLTVEEVALQLDRASSTVTGHLIKYLRARRISDVTPFLPQATVERVTQAAEEVGTGRLKPIFEALEESVTYDDIRIVVTSLSIEQDPTDK